MPVTGRQFNDAQQAISRRLNAASSIGGTRELFMAVKNIRPKGFRGSILKRVGWPTSWGVLVGLSPAQISQNREPRLAERAWSSVSPRGINGESPSNTTKLLFWRRLLAGYFAANADAIPESDFPQWRKPSWMTEAEANGIKELIRTSYQGEAPLEETMPVEDTPSADDEVVAEMSANMDGEEETVVVEESATTTRMTEAEANPNVRPRGRLFESLYALYGSYFREAHFGVNHHERLQQIIAPNGDMRQGNTHVRNSVLGILALEKLGYEYTGIKNFLQAINNRGFAIKGVRVPRNGNFDAYVTVDLKAHSPSPSRYTSTNAYRIMSEACRVPIPTLKRQFTPSNGRGLQVFRFSGRGMNMVGVQVLSLNYMNGRANETTYAEGVRKINNAKSEAMEALRNAVSSTETPSTASQAEPIAVGDKYYLLGIQFFASGRTFRSRGTFLKSINLTGTNSYVFYFVRKREEGFYDIFRNVWGTQNFGGRIINVSNEQDLDALKVLWNQSGKLNNENELLLQKVLGSLQKRDVRRAWAGGRPDFPVTRGGADNITVPFGQISNMSTGVNDELGRLSAWRFQEGEQNDELASGTSVNDAETNERIARSVKAIKTQKIDRTFAYEIEGDMAYSRGSSKQAVLSSSINKVLDERGIQRGYRWEINESPRIFTTTLKGDLSVRGQRPFEIDTPVFIPANVDLAKTNIDNAVRQSEFEKYKWNSDAKMWQWVSVFSEALLESSVRIHKSAGLHIHVSATDYNNDDNKRYLENYAGFEKLFDLMMPVNSRKGGRSYNSSIVQRGKITTGSQRGQSTPSPTPSEWRRSGRTGRSKVRTTTGIGTIEFRHPMTNIEGDLIKHFIILAYSLVEVSKIKKFNSFKFKDLESFLPDATATFLFNRIEDLSQQDLSQEDARRFFGDGGGTRTELERRNLA
jgi:hypothetical protein